MGVVSESGGAASINVVDAAMKNDLLDRPHHAHLVQFYESDDQLVESLSQYLLAGLAAGEPLVLIATPAHRSAFAAALTAKGFDAETLVASDRLTMLDARETLALFMRDDVPVPELFYNTVGALLRRVRTQHHATTIRAYGEMVDVLWRDGNSSAALALEGLWNVLAQQQMFSLYCAYAIGQFYRNDGGPGIEAVCATHSHVLDNGEEVAALRAQARALRDALDERAAAEAQLRALQRIGAALHSELDLEKVVQRVTDEATKICRAEFGAFFYNVTDPGGERYTLYTIAGVPREHFAKFPMPRNTAIFGPTFRGDGVVRIDDVKKDPRYGKSAPHHGMPKGHLPVTSYLAAPVVARSGEVLGGLFFGHSAPAQFRRADEDALVAIAAHAAIAIENARLYDQQRRARIAAEQARDRTERLQRVTAALSHAVSAEEAARIVIAEIRDLLGVEAGAIVLFDHTGKQIERYVVEGDFHGLAAEPPLDQLPIVFEGRTLGAIALRNSTPRELSADDAAFIRALGRQCGQALERARLHAATEAARAEAETANRAKDEFLAMLGHELRNPLSPILTAVQLMRMRGESSSAKEQNIIERQVNHLIHLVDDLLDISRITRGKVELDRKPTKVADIVAKAVEVTAPLMQERRHELAVEVAADDLWLDADEVRMTQVVSNLLTNAAKYTERGGKIALRVERDGDAAVIRVRDNGAGIAADLLPRVFDLFVQGYQTSDRSGGGLGIGLALVRKLVEMHGGSVSATSAGLRMGSEFTVRVPALDTTRTAASSDGDRPLRDRLRISSRRVLVVDDNIDAASLLCELLRSVGHDVREAHDGEQALELQRTFQPEIAILDIGLPGMDGYALATALRDAAGPAIRLMAVTGYGQPQDRKRAESSGFAAHFVKPVAIAKLLAEIEIRGAAT